MTLREKRDLLASAVDGHRPESGFAEELNTVGGMTSAFRNHLVPES